MYYSVGNDQLADFIDNIASGFVVGNSLSKRFGAAKNESTLTWHTFEN